MSFYTPINQLSSIVGEVRNSYNSGVTKPLHYRKYQLHQFFRLITDNKVNIQNALFEDLQKPEQEAVVTEIGFLKNEISDALDNLDEWAAPEYPAKVPAYAMDTAYIKKEPFGVVLILGAWNYPFHLLLAPLVAAMAAGNAAIIKPSELAPHTAKLVAELIPRYLDPLCYRVVNGGPEETSKLLEFQFDYIFYTGSTTVGKIVMAAAAKNLTPVTLELGGKSPCIVYDDCDLEIAAKRICWGKFTNVGQTCVAPDYIICTPETQNKLVKHLVKTIVDFFGENPQNSASYGRIVNGRHVQRLKRYIDSVDKAKIAFGGRVDENTLYVEPTIITNASPNDMIMQDEIFGPILPIMTFNDMRDGLAFAAKRDRPLALYAFTSDKRRLNSALETVTSGSVCVNDTMMQIGLPTLPFGGIGASGMGSYHGKFGFDTFTHKRSVLQRSFALDSINSLRIPPYNSSKMSWLNMILFKSPSSEWSPLRLLTKKNFSWIVFLGLIASNIYFIQKSQRTA